MFLFVQKATKKKRVKQLTWNRAKKHIFLFLGNLMMVNKAQILYKGR